MIKRLPLVLLSLLLILLLGCTASDPYPDDAYFKDIYSNGVLINPAGGSSNWGSIGGTLTNQLDLVDTLGTKQGTSAKGQASGYAGLDTNGLVPTVHLGSGTANNTKFLRGDQTWDSPIASAAWGSITGTLSSQTDLNSALSGKQPNSTILSGLASLSYTTGSPIVRMDGASSFTLDSATYLTSYTETDPVVKALTGIITSNGSVISSITDSSSSWNTAFGWGNHASGGYLTGVTVEAPLSGAGTPASHLVVDLSSKQAAHANLTSLSALAWASGSPLVKMTSANTFALDQNVYLTGNQSITLGGILSGSGTTSITASAASGYYMPATSDQTTWNAKQTGHANLASLSSLSYASPSFVKMTGANAFTLDTSTYLTSNQAITLSGDASGSGTTSIAVTNTGLRSVSVPVLLTGYLYYNGSSFAWQTPSSSGLDPVATVTLWDDFASGLLTTGNIGSLGWGLTGTTPTVIASVANHSGIRQIPTTAVSGNISAVWLGGAVNADTVLFSDYCDLTFIVGMTDVTSDTVFVGAMDAMGTAVGNQDRYGFEYIDSSDTYWVMVTGNGSSSTRTATNITVAINTWYKLRVVRNVSGVNYYIDGVSKGSVSTTLPDTSLNIGFHIQTNTTTAKYLQADLFSMTLAVTR